MLWLNYFRRRTAIRLLINQKTEIRSTGFIGIIWQPATLSILREYLGTEDEVYVALSKIDFESAPPANTTLQDWKDLLKGISVLHLETAIKQIQMGKVSPDKHNIFVTMDTGTRWGIITAILGAFWTGGMIFQSNLISEPAHKNEVKELNDKVDKLNKQNECLRRLIPHPAEAEAQSETDLKANKPCDK